MKRIIAAGMVLRQHRTTIVCQMRRPNFRQNAHFYRSFTGVRQGKIGYYDGNSASRWHTKVRTGGRAVLP